jgi:hypothetical protein
MSTRIIAETAPQRNRRLLLAAWDRGVTVQSHWAGRYNVTSGTQTGVLHEVVTWRDGDFNMHEACSCPWGVKHGEVITFNAGTEQAHVAGVPCAHILIVRWHRLSAEAKARRLSTDRELAAAYDGRAGLAEVAA